MYFKDKENTNIDNEFKQNNFNLNKLKWPLIIISGIILLIIIIILIIKFIPKPKTNYFIDLIGDEIITIYQGNDYLEPGYNAYDNKQNDLTNEVDIKSTLDINNLGNYEIIYTIGNISVTRYVNVIEKPTGATYIYLKGKSTIYLNINEKYSEPGYLVVDTVDSNLTDKVKVTNNLDITKQGNYKIIYSVVNSSGVTTSTYRTVIVMDSEISLSQNTKEYTNDQVKISIFVKDNYFDYLILPNNEKISKNEYIYQVSSNGTYKFISVNKKGTKKEASITITNIDKVAPTGTCSGVYENKKTTINISAKDNIGINKYVLNGKSYTENKITLDSKLEKANITVYDKSGNSTNISCNIVNKGLDVKPGLYEKKYSVFKYAEFIPDNPQENMALIVYLHGDGVNGSNFSSVYNYGLPKYMKQGILKQYPAIFIAPVCTNRSRCYYHEMMSDVISLINKVVEEHKIDKKHIIITGHSRGAIATWAFASNYPDFFSAAVPVSCRPVSVNYSNLAKIPIKAFVGSKSDDYIYYNDMNKAVKNTNAKGGNAELILMNGYGHGGTAGVYIMEGYDLINWMISQ